MLMLATPHTRLFDGGYVDSILGMDKPEGMHFIRLEGHAVDVARNRLVQAFLASDKQYLLFVDSDATWPGGAVMAMLQHNVPMVTGCIYRRGLPPVPCFGRVAEGGVQGEQTKYNFGESIHEIRWHVQSCRVDPETTQDALLLPSKLIEIDGCGMHFAMIRRDVLEAVEPPWFVAQDGAGEDFYFCRKVRAAGFNIYADLGVHTGHLAGPGFELGLRELLAFYQHTDMLDASKEGAEIWEA